MNNRFMQESYKTNMQVQRITVRLIFLTKIIDVLLAIFKAIGSSEAGEPLASPDFRPNSNISALTFFNFRVINM